MIIWLASYPKSGNTWVRSIVSALAYSNDGNFKMNMLSQIQQFPRISHFKNINENLEDINIIKKYWIKAQEKINLGQSKEDSIELLLYKSIKVSSKTATMNVALSKKAENLSLEILPGTRLAITKDGYRIVKKKWTKKLKRGDSLSWSYSHEKR